VLAIHSPLLKIIFCEDRRTRVKNNIDSPAELQYQLKKAVRKGVFTHAVIIGHQQTISFQGIRQLREERVTVELSNDYFNTRRCSAANHPGRNSRHPLAIN
jgi:hypothetical protein